MDTNTNIPVDQEVKPDTIFKFESFTEQSRQNLKMQAIWFGSPTKFNDPYDCAIYPQIAELTDDQLDAIREHHISTSFSAWSIAHKNTYRQLDRPSLRSKYAECWELNTMDNVNYWRNNLAATCFSEHNDDLLMWAHYGGKYKGFCLEFSTICEPFLNMEKVKYVPSIPTINYYNLTVKNDIKQLKDLYCTKSCKWKYESEWRVLEEKNTNEEGKLITYQPTALKSIYFGPEIEESSINIIRDILAVQNPNVKFYKSQRSQTEFKVIFEVIEKKI